MKRGTLYRLSASACAFGAAAAKETWVGRAFEIAAKAGEFGAVTVEARQAGLDRLVESHMDRVQTALDPWLNVEFGAGGARRADADAALQAIDELLGHCLPDASSLVADDLDPEKVSFRVANKMAQADPSFMPPRHGSEPSIQYSVLNKIVLLAYGDAIADSKVFEQLEAAVHAEQLRLTRSLTKTVAELHGKLDALLAGNGVAGADPLSRNSSELYNRIEARLSAKPTDDIADALRNEGARLLAAGDYLRAREKYHEAVRHLVGLLRANEDPTLRNILIETLMEASRVARLGGDYRAATDDLFDAGQLLPSQDVDRKWHLQMDRAAMLREQGLLGDTGALGRAVMSYRDALALVSRQLHPQWWAEANDQLGLALFLLAQREGGNAHLLAEAAEAFRAGLLEFTEDSHPLRWSDSMMNLGVTLFRWGEKRDPGEKPGQHTEQLCQAVKAFRAVLRQRTRSKDSLRWAATMENVGAALSVLAEETSRLDIADEAVKAYRQAQEVRREGLVPSGQWGAVSYGLGNCLHLLGALEIAAGQLEAASGHLVDALHCYDKSVNAFTEADMVSALSMARGQRGYAASRLASIRGGAPPG